MTFQDTSGTVASTQADIPIPPYGELFRLLTWMDNVFADWHWDLSEPDERFTRAHDAIAELALAACVREGKSFGEMMQDLRAGEFDRV